MKDLCEMVSTGKDTIILGDFNTCYFSERSNQVFKAMEQMEFQQLVKQPTHIAGRLIDLVFFRSSDPDICYKVKQQAQFFTDHDLLQVFKGRIVLSKIWCKSISTIISANLSEN